MRELNECTAEVFRRSQKRIKERRRNRIRILAFCIPCCLVLSVWGVFGISHAETEDSCDAADREQIKFDNTGEMVEYLYFSLEIKKSNTVIESVTDAAETARIFELIDGCFAEDDGIDNSSTETQPDMDEVPVAQEEISIIFYELNGRETVYILKGNLLLNENNGESAALSQKRLSELKTALKLIK